MVLIFAASHHAKADTVVYQNGSSNAFVSNYNGAQGTTIYSGDPNNYGKYGNPIIGPGEEGLLRFDLSSLSGKFSSVNSLSLQLNIGQLDYNGSVSSGTVDAYAILPADAGWVKGTAIGSVQSDSADWNYAKYNTQAWAGSPGLSTAGIDYSPTLLGSFTYSGVGTYALNFNGFSSAQLTSLVSSWENASNPGILLVDPNPNDATILTIGTSPSSPSLYLPESPSLTINYALSVPEPSSWALLALGLAGLVASRMRKRAASISPGHRRHPRILTSTEPLRRGDLLCKTKLIA